MIIIMTSQHVQALGFFISKWANLFWSMILIKDLVKLGANLSATQIFQEPFCQTCQIYIPGLVPTISLD